MNMYPQMETPGGTCTPKQKYEWACCIASSELSHLLMIGSPEPLILVLGLSYLKEANFFSMAALPLFAKEGSGTSHMYKNSPPSPSIDSCISKTWGSPIQKRAVVSRGILS